MDGDHDKHQSGTQFRSSKNCTNSRYGQRGSHLFVFFLKNLGIIPKNFRKAKKLKTILKSIDTSVSL
jgi:hypothetical protein